MPDVTGAVPDTHRDLLDAPLTATLTTVDAHGRPQSTAVWYLVDGDGRLIGSTTSDRQKFKNLAGNPQCDLFVIDPHNPFRTLEVRAQAELVPDPDQAAVRALAEAYGMDPEMLVNPTEDRYTIIFRPRRVVVNPPAPG
jgi:PPOX class probable F420-dependent enzyme